MYLFVYKTRSNFNVKSNLKILKQANRVTIERETLLNKEPKIKLSKKISISVLLL